jgi:hypothetical protein
MVTKEQMIERMVRAFRSVDEPDLSEGLQLEYRLSAALDASGLWPVYEAAIKARPALAVALSCHTSLDWTDERAASEELGRTLTAMEQTNG